MISRTLLCILIVVTCQGLACRARHAESQAGQNRNDDPTCVRKVDLRLISATISDDISAMDEALKSGADVNATAEGLGPPIMIAVITSARAVELLLDHGANVNVTDKQGSTPLIAAAMTNHREVAKLLIKRGADVNAVANIKRKDGGFAKFTALSMAKVQGLTEMVQLLLEAGAKDEIVDRGPAPLT